MGRFLNMPLEYDRINDGKEIKLTKKFGYLYKENDKIKVPEGFVCDGASIPKFAWSIIGHPFGEYLEAAVIHDYLYRKAIGAKSHADKVFLEGMKDLKVNIIKRRLMYWAVVIGGKGSWK